MNSFSSRGLPPQEGTAVFSSEGDYEMAKSQYGSNRMQLFKKLFEDTASKAGAQSKGP